MKMNQVVALLLLSISFASAANILAVLPLASPSHQILYTPLITALAKRGHNVTFVTPKIKDPKIPNLTILEITGLIEEMKEQVGDKLDYSIITDMPLMLGQYIFFNFTAETCIKTMKSQAWTQLMNYPSDTKFDLLILEAFGAECLAGSLSKFGFPPVVLVNGWAVPFWMMERLGTPNMISHMPHYSTSFTDRMSLFQRFMNFVYYIHEYYLYYYSFLPNMDRAAKEYFGPETPSFHTVFDRVSLGLANYDHVLDYSWAKTPNLIPIAGIQVQEPSPLPEDLKKFMDEAKEGVILFSLGSNVQSANIHPDKRQVILDAFADLPQKVLWKFEAENLPEHSKNVKIGKWLPQSDILAHPNIKLFISHSGRLSTVESIYREVPVIGIPFFGDQCANIQILINNGAGIRLNFNDITKESLKLAISTILTNSSYKANMKKLSQRLKDHPQTPLERAVSSIEYVLRHNGAYHMRSAALDLNMVQYFLLDVIALVLAIPLLILCTFYCLCCRGRPKRPQKFKKI